MNDIRPSARDSMAVVSLFNRGSCPDVIQAFLHIQLCDLCLEFAARTLRGTWLRNQEYIQAHARHLSKVASICFSEDALGPIPADGPAHPAGRNNGVAAPGSPIRGIYKYKISGTNSSSLSSQPSEISLPM